MDNNIRVPNGCSVPSILRLVIPKETSLQTDVCDLHDVAYIQGGTKRQRAIADANLLLGLLLTGMEIDLANQYYTAVRVCGKSHFGPSGEYTDDTPAKTATVTTTTTVSTPTDTG